MRKRSFLCSAAVFALLLVSSACDRNGEKKPSGGENTADTVSVQMEYRDTLGKSELSCFMKGALPNTDNKQLKKIINEWINERLGGVYKMEDPLNSNAILDFYRKRWVDSTTAVVKELASLGDYSPDCTWDTQFKIMAEGKKYISLSITSYRYEGGAHGGTVVSQQTFRKEDGRELGWNNMFNDENKYMLADVIQKGLAEYFKVKPGEDVMDYLLLSDGSSFIPLPETPPVLLKDGVGFVYQQYEIAAYAMGMPRFVVPYSEIKPLLTTTALSLIEEETEDKL